MELFYSCVLAREFLKILFLFFQSHHEIKLSYVRNGSVTFIVRNLTLSIVTVNMGIQERIKDIELELSRTQKNKATTTHIGMLKGQLARLRTQLLLPSTSGGGGGDGAGFAVAKSGDGRVALIGAL